MPKGVTDIHKIRKGLAVAIRNSTLSASYVALMTLPKQKSRVIHKLCDYDPTINIEKIYLEADMLFEKMKDRANKGLPLKTIDFFYLMDKFESYMLDGYKANQKLTKANLKTKGTYTINDIGGTLINKTHIDTEVGNIKNHIRPYLNFIRDKEVVSLTRKDWDRVRNIIAKQDGSNSSKNKRLTTIRNVIRHAIEYNLCDDNVFIPQLKRFQIKTEIPQDKIMTLDIYERIRDRAKEKINEPINSNELTDAPIKRSQRAMFYYWILYLANVSHRTWDGGTENTIPKWSDITPKWEDVKDDPNEPIFIKRPSEKKHNYMALTLPRLRTYLKRIENIYQARGIKTKYIFAQLQNQRNKKVGDSCSYRTQWINLMNELGYVDKSKGKNKDGKYPITFRPYDLRHYFITIRMYNMEATLTKGDLKTFATQCGTSMRMIEEIYTHVLQDKKINAKLVKNSLPLKYNEVDIFDKDGIFVKRVKKGSMAHRKAFRDYPNTNIKP